MSEQSKKVALPAYLPRRLEAFRVARDTGHIYLIRDKLLGKTHDFEPWQFFVLEVLPGCEEFGKLASVFEDRFGQKLTAEQVGSLFATLADNKLLDDDAARHPLLAPYLKKTYTSTEDGKPQPKSFQGLSPGAVAAPAAAAAAVSHAAPPPAAAAASAAAGEQTAPDATLPAGVQDAYGIDSRTVKKMWTLFDPTGALKVLVPLLAWLKLIVYPLPLLLFVSLWIFGRYPSLVLDDIRRLHGATTLIEHIVFSMFTINLTATLVIAAVAHHFRASVKAIGISIFLGFLPRFVARITHAEQLSRREKLWLHATPLIVRAVLFCIGMLGWYMLRDESGVLPKAALGVALLTALDVVFASGNPLVKGSCYHLLTTFTNEPHLRGKAFKAVVGRLRGDRFKEADNNLLVGYGFATLLYAYVLIALAVFMVAVFLGQARIGGVSVIIALVMGVYLVRGTFRRFKLIGEAYERSERFERWRKRAMPEEAAEKPVEPTAESRFWSWARIAALLIFIVILFLPYPYEPGGHIKIFPSRQEPLGTDVPGQVEAVFFDGGEKLKKGTVIARLTVPDITAALATADARVLEQAAVLADLKARPKPEEVQLAEREVEVAQKQLQYSTEKVPRYEKLYADKSIAFDELDAARRARDVDQTQVAEKKARLDLVKVPVTKEQIQAADAKLVALKEERDGLKQKLGRTTLTMPFDGSILTLHLKQKTNSYLDRGQPFALIENTEYVTAEIEVPEADVGRIQLGAAIRARPNTYSDLEFEGKVTLIDRNVTVQPFGNVIKVIAEIKNRDDMLRTGMGGYAKVTGQTLPVWKAFTLAVIRFFNVQVWSWIP